MKKYFLMIAILFTINIAMLAQEEVSQPSETYGSEIKKKIVSSMFENKIDVTQFMGIPVDGTKKEMIKKLKKKGFKPVYNDMLKGEFNGRDVYVTVAANKNKVWRIMLLDANPSDESSIKRRFNDLCWQFLNSEKYHEKSDDTSMIIPDDEDISYNMTKQNKNYIAFFTQRADVDLFFSKFPKEELNDLTENDRTFIENFLNVQSLLCKKVQVVIEKSSRGNGYVIVMYYDNVHNQPNGEDL